MEKIASFQVNHLTLEPGIFLSRRDCTPSGDIISTFDIRLTRPNREPAVDPKALHAMEHLAATFLRNHPQWSSKIVYWGPMGCLTGNYLIVSGEYLPEDILPLMIETFSFIASFEGEIPGASPRDCGNYSFMNLEEAKKVASGFVEGILLHPTEANLNYPE